MRFLIPLARALAGLCSRNRLCIVTYHRVLAEKDPLMPLEPDIAEFERHLDWLKTYTRGPPLTEASARLKAGTLPARAVCITFDDGYLNNLANAAPLLAARNLPATCFVTTGAMDAGIMWNDLVYEAVRRFPERIDLTPLPFEPGLGCVALPDPHARQRLIEAIIDQIKYLPLERRLELAGELFTLTGETPPRLMLRAEELHDMESHGIAIGGHTHNHPILAELTDDASREEIARNRQQLQDIAAGPVLAFAYPNGKAGRDYKARDALIAQSEGYACAVTTEWGFAKPTHSPFELPRVTVSADSEQAFLAQFIKSAVRARLS